MRETKNSICKYCHVKIWYHHEYSEPQTTKDQWIGGPLHHRYKDSAAGDSALAGKWRYSDCKAPLITEHEPLDAFEEQAYIARGSLSGAARS